MSLVILLCHGSRDRRATSAAHALAARTQHVLGEPVRAAFLDHAWPTLPAAIGRELDAGLVGSIVVVPMLLSRAYHATTDIPAAVAAARFQHSVDVTVTAPIGPDVRLLDAFDRQLPPGTPAVLAAAGTTSAHAQAELGDLADFWERSRSARVVAAYASHEPSVEAACRRLADVTGADPVVGSFVLFPGEMADRISRQARGHQTSPPLCESDDLLRVLADRVASLEPAR
jgi:sirohydrochlorin ferrochelatase